MLNNLDLGHETSNQTGDLTINELESGGGFGSAAAGIGAAGAGAAQVDFYAQYYYFVYQPAPPLVCGDGICA